MLVRLVIGSMTVDRGGELLDLAVHAHEVHLEAGVLGPLGVDAQQAVLDPALEVEADGAHVPA